MAVRRSARQVAASRRNLAKARRKRNYKRAAIIGTGAAIGAAGGYAAYRKQDRKKNVYLYHNTNRQAAKGIRRQGFKGADSRYSDVGTVGRVYFAKDRNTSKAYGNKTVRIKMPRQKFEKVARLDSLHGPKYSGPKPPKRGPGTVRGSNNFYTIDASHLKGIKVRRVARVPELDFNTNGIRRMKYNAGVTARNLRRR